MKQQNKPKSVSPGIKKFSESESIRHFFGPRHVNRPANSDLEQDSIYKESEKDQNPFAAISKLV
jgi:hypothetical protein